MDFESKIGNADLKQTSKTFDCDKDNEILAYIGENSKDIQDINDLPACMSGSNTLRSDASSDSHAGRTCLKFGSPSVRIHGCGTLVHKYPHISGIHEPVTAGLKNNSTRVEFKKLTSLGGVPKTKHLSNVDKNEELHSGTRNYLSLSEDRLRMTSAMCTDLSVRSSSALGNSLLAECRFIDLSKCPDSPVVNENTVLNLVDITIDESYVTDVGGIEDLLASSFVARLKDVTSEDQSSASKAQRDDFISSRSPSPIPTEKVSFSDEDGNLVESFVGLNLEGAENHKLRTSYFSKSCASQPVEECSLTSRLLKRFQGKDGRISNTLRLISGDKSKCELGYKNENRMCTTDDVCVTKKQKSYSRSDVVTENSRPLEDVTNQRRNGRNVDIVVVD